MHQVNSLLIELVFLHLPSQTYICHQAEATWLDMFNVQNTYVENNNFAKCKKLVDLDHKSVILGDYIRSCRK